MPKPSGKHGYTGKDIENICRVLDIDMEDFFRVFGVNTVAVVDGEYNYYQCDVETTLFRLTNGKVGKDHGWD
jgi:hypothetical protein